MTDSQPILYSMLSGDLFNSLSAKPLFELCREQITDTCHLIDQCWLRIHRDDTKKNLISICMKITLHEQTIFQHASANTSARLAHWVRGYSGYDSASDSEAHAAYIMACAIKALETLIEWMETTHQEAWSHTSEPPTDWPWDLYCQFVERQVDPDERIKALDLHILNLEPIKSLPCLIDDELTPVGDRAIKNAHRKKGGIISGMERNRDISARDAAIVKQGRHYWAAGMPDRHIATKVHAWLKSEVAKPLERRPEWITLETEKGLSRKSVEAILKRNFVL